MNESDEKLYPYPQTRDELEHNLAVLGPAPVGRLTLAMGNVDRLGRKQPRRLGLPDYLLLIARLDPNRVRAVPARAIVEEGLDGDGEHALLDCPCGAHPIVRASLDKCSGCERHYALSGPGLVWVAYGAMPVPENPATART